MWTNGNKWHVNDLLFKNKVIGDEIDEQVKRHIAASTGCIAEGLQGHYPAERWIEEIYQQ